MLLPISDTPYRASNLILANSQKGNTPRDVADDRSIKALFPKPAGLFF